MNEYETKMIPSLYKEISNYAYMEYIGISTESILTENNVTVCVASKDRKESFKRLSDSINIICPKIVLTQGEVYNIPGWAEFNEAAGGILPSYMEMIKYYPNLPKEQCTTNNSLSWARNEVILQCNTDWIFCIDDDFVLSGDWFKYCVDVQQASQSPIVMHNFGAFVMHKETFYNSIMSIDERYINGSSGCEDEDFFARWLESGTKMVIGFNKEHTFDSTKRGSSTGYDHFTHIQGTIGGCRTPDPIGFDNQTWHWTKWSRSLEDTGIQTRPPFKGWIKRNIEKEIDWIKEYH